MRERLSYHIGIDETTNEPVIGGLYPNLIVGGGWSSGKTTIICNIIDELIRKNNPDELKLVLIDRTKMGIALGHYSDDPHLLQPVICNTEGVEVLIDEIMRIASERAETIKKEREKDPACNCAEKYNQKYPGKMPPIVVVIDEIDDILLDKKELKMKFIRIVQACQRARDIFFIIGASTSGGDIFWHDGLMKGNFISNVILLRPSYDKEYRHHFSFGKELDFSCEPGWLCAYYYYCAQKVSNKIIFPKNEHV